MLKPPTLKKNMTKNGFIFPNFRGEHTKKYLKPPRKRNFPIRCFHTHHRVATVSTVNLSSSWTHIGPNLSCTLCCFICVMMLKQIGCCSENKPPGNGSQSKNMLISLNFGTLLETLLLKSLAVVPAEAPGVCKVRGLYKTQAG